MLIVIRSKSPAGRSAGDPGPEGGWLHQVGRHCLDQPLQQELQPCRPKDCSSREEIYPGFPLISPELHHHGKVLLGDRKNLL